MLSIVRSPAKVAWWVVYNNVTIEVCATKSEAAEVVARLEKML